MVVLFNRDLRIHDHPALAAASREARRVVPLFVLDPVIGRSLESANRETFLSESLADLRRSLRGRGGELFVRRGDVVEETTALADRVHASGVWASDDVGPIARERQERLAAACAEVGRSFRTFPGVAVVPPGELVPAGKDHYAVFTPYWLRWHAHAWRDPVRAPARVVVPQGVARGSLAVKKAAGGPHISPTASAWWRDARASSCSPLGQALGRTVRGNPRRPGRGPHVATERLLALRLPVPSRAGTSGREP